MRWVGIMASALCGIMAATGVAIAAGDEWPVYNGGPDSIHYSPLRQINRDNVSRLKVAWTYDTGDAYGEGARVSEMECNPIIVNGVLYAVSPRLRIFALNAATGKRLWQFDPLQGARVLTRLRSRGVTYWSGDGEARIFFTFQNYLYALDAGTGKKITSFGKAGRVDLREGFGRDPATVSIRDPSPGIIYKDIIILGSSGYAPGDIRGFDVRTGKIRWVFHTIPHPGEAGYDGWPKDAWKTVNGANNWAGMAVDEKRGLVFVPTASAGAFEMDFLGGGRPGANLFANSILALDAGTGKLRWYFQAVHHDLWDRDFPAPPSLVTVMRNGAQVDAVAAATKSGLLYVLDRDTGKSLFPIVERSAPKALLEGEPTWPTQPFPLIPKPFGRQSVTADMLTVRTPEAHQAALAEFNKVRSGGQFVPPSVEGTIIFPGLDGGAEWGGTAFDPASGIIYVNANEMPWILKLKRRPPATAEATGKAIYLSECSGCHGADLKGHPPEFPALAGIGDRMGLFDIVALATSGAGRMPSFARLGFNRLKVAADYVLTGHDGAVYGDGPAGKSGPQASPYVFAGFSKFLDPDGYPAITPPWGTLSAINLATGEYVWQIPFGTYPELAAKGLGDTGSENYGGGAVTAGGILFIGATLYDSKFHAFDAATGKLLWQTTLPAAGNATPAVYAAGGREFVVIAAGGGKTTRGRPGGGFIAFALPENPGGHL